MKNINIVKNCAVWGAIATGQMVNAAIAYEIAEACMSAESVFEKVCYCCALGMMAVAAVWAASIIVVRLVRTR